MIIRAISDDEDDADFQDDANGTSPLYPKHPQQHPTFGGNASSSRVHGAKIAWISLSVVLILSLLVNLSAMMTILWSRNTLTDAFAMLPMLWSILFSSSASPMSVLPATTLNNFIGIVFVMTWIHLREQRLNRRQRATNVPGGSLLCTMGLPYSAIIGVLCFGHMASCLYILMALFESNGDLLQFWLGRRTAYRKKPDRFV